MIDIPAVFNRVMSWASYAYDIHGELYWGVNAADREHSASWEDQWVAGGNGDGTLTYPGRPGVIGGKTFVPIASQRLKHIRDGIEDIELMYLAEAKVGRSSVLNEVRKVVSKTYDFTHDPNVLLAVREALAKLVVSGHAAQDV